MVTKKTKRQPVLTISEKNVDQARAAMQKTIDQGFGVNMEAFNRSLPAAKAQFANVATEAQIKAAIELLHSAGYTVSKDGVTKAGKV
jgi:hypothetical protein